MKRILLSGILVSSLFGVAHAASQPQSLGVVEVSTLTLTGSIIPQLYTAAQLAAMTPSTTGQIVVCGNCVRSAICIGSGTVNADSWVIAVTTGTKAGATWSGFDHCQ